MKKKFEDLNIGDTFTFVSGEPFFRNGQLFKKTEYSKDGFNMIYASGKETGMRRYSAPDNEVETVIQLVFGQATHEVIYSSG